MPSNNSVPKHLILCFSHQLSARSVPLSSALFQCPFATMFAWRWRISSSPLRVLQERASSRLGFEQQFRIKGSDKHLEPPCPHHCGGRRQPRSRLDISADSFCSAPSAPSLRLQCLRYADEARDDSDAAIRAARRSSFLGPTFPVLAVSLSPITTPGSRAAPVQAVEPAILTPAVLAPLPAASKRPLHAVAVAALRHACCACLPVVPPRRRTAVTKRGGAAPGL